MPTEHRNPTRLPASIGAVRRMFGATGASWIQLDGAGEFRAFVSDGHDPALLSQFVDHYAALDPTRDAVMQASPGSWFRDDDALSPRHTNQPEYVNDFSMKAGIRRLRGGKVFENASGSAFFTVHRPLDAQRFGDEALALLDRLQPHLARFSRLMVELEQAIPALASTQAVVDMLGTGVCVVDGECRLRFANPAAEKILSALGGLRVRRGRVGSEQPETEDRLNRAVRLATRFPRQASAFTIHADPGSAPRLQVRVVPLQAWQPLAQSGRASLALLFLARGSATLNPSELRQLFDLTRSEADLVGLFAQGLTPAQCAAQREVSITTVRAQLKSIYAKTGVDTHAQLMALVLTLPELAP